MINISARPALVFAFDLLAAVMAWGGGLLLHFDFSLPASHTGKALVTGAALLLVHGIACSLAGLYRGIWVFASLPDLKRVLKAVIASAAALAVMMLLDHGTPPLPRAMLILYPMMLLLIMGGSRAAGRMWKEYRTYGDLMAAGKPVVIIGAGTGGALLVRELERSPDWRVVALVDDDPTKWRRDLRGRPIAGGIDVLPQVLKEHKAQHVILAMPSAAIGTLKHATDVAIRAGAQVFTLPGLDDLMSGKVAINSMRPVNIEDLLGREPVQIDSLHVQAMVTGKTVLITGAGDPSAASSVASWPAFLLPGWYWSRTVNTRCTTSNNGSATTRERSKSSHSRATSGMPRGWTKFSPPGNHNSFSMPRPTNTSR